MKGIGIGKKQIHCKQTNVGLRIQENQQITSNNKSSAILLVIRYKSIPSLASIVSNLFKILKLTWIDEEIYFRESEELEESILQMLIVCN